MDICKRNLYGQIRAAVESSKVVFKAQNKKRSSEDEVKNF